MPKFFDDAHPGARALGGLTLLALLWAGTPGTVHAQDRLKTMPGYARYQWMSRQSNVVQLGALSVVWTNEGGAFEYQREGKRYRYNIATRTTSLLLPPGTNGTARERGSSERRRRQADEPRRPERGRQYTSAPSPDGRFKAVYRDRNVWIVETNGTEIAVTTQGCEAGRIKYGSANWVYGEELYQTTALWWSSNSQKLAFYRFDESKVPDYYLALDQTKAQSRLDVEPYMKVGVTNPLVDILVYDLASRKTVTVDVRSGRPFDDAVVGHYVYGVSWTADSRELLWHRTNRRQNIMELCAADPDRGTCRVIVREEWPASWTENLPTRHFLRDGERFIWASERTGWRNFYLYHRDGRLLAPLTQHTCDVESIAHVDEAAGRLWYTAHSGDNPMKIQLHRVGLDGCGARELTDPARHHTVNVAPDGRHFIDVAQTHDQPPSTVLRDAEGQAITELARSDLTRFRKLGLRPVERLQFKAADGTTDLYGLLHFPSQFNPQRTYPLLVSVYAGPATSGASESFTVPNRLTEYGFLLASFDSRSASGRGKVFLDAIYGKLGIVEVDDQAAGVRSLWNRPYVDRRRVGMYGTSYGGTVSALSLLRYPDVFHAACANSAVTDFRNYDTIYTERYLGLSPENKAAYDAARVMSYVTNLTGRLMVFYGTADNNVHPANALQLVQALQQAGKSFEVQVGPDQGHTSVNRERMMEFFIENLKISSRHPTAVGREHGKL